MTKSTYSASTSRFPLVSDYIDHLKAQSYSERTLEDTLTNLQRFASHYETDHSAFEPQALTAPRAIQTLNKLLKAHKYSLLTIKRTVTALKAFFQWLYETNRLPANPLATLSFTPPLKEVRRSHNYKVSFTLSITEAMHDRLKQVAKGRAINDVIRAYIRQGLDNEFDIIASRRHFTGQFVKRMDELERLLHWYSILILTLSADRFSFLAINLLNIPPDREGDFSTSAFLDIASGLVVDHGFEIKQGATQTIDEAHRRERAALDHLDLDNPAAE